MSLSPQAARTDLTDRECAKLLGALIGGLCQQASPQTVRDAVRWWAEADEAWNAMEASTTAAMAAATAAIKGTGQ